MATKPKVKEQSEVLFSKLRQSSNYRDFLKTYLDIRGLSLSDLARAAGFGRGFPGDVLSGKRRLTAKSYYPFEKALKLPLAGRKLFRCLVATEEPDVFPDLDPSEAHRQLNILRHKDWGRPRRHLQEVEAPSFQRLLKDHDVIGVYAASGSPDTGASRDQISTRTRLSELELTKSLQRLQEIGLLKKEGEIYFPRDLHLFLQTSDRSQLLSSLFQKAAESAHRRVPKAAISDAEFFFTSQFCIRESVMPALKAALRETMLKFVDESIETEGDRVVRLLTALHF